MLCLQCVFEYIASKFYRTVGIFCVCTIFIQLFSAIYFPSLFSPAYDLYFFGWAILQGSHENDLGRIFGSRTIFSLIYMPKLWNLDLFWLPLYLYILSTRKFFCSFGFVYSLTNVLIGYGYAGIIIYKNVRCWTTLFILLLLSSYLLFISFFFLSLSFINHVILKSPGVGWIWWSISRPMY